MSSRAEAERSCDGLVHLCSSWMLPLQAPRNTTPPACVPRMIACRRASAVGLPQKRAGTAATRPPAPLVAWLPPAHGVASVLLVSPGAFRAPCCPGRTISMITPTQVMDLPPKMFVPTCACMSSSGVWGCTVKTKPSARCSSSVSSACRVPHTTDHQPPPTAV